MPRINDSLQYPVVTDAAQVAPTDVLVVVLGIQQMQLPISVMKEIAQEGVVTLTQMSITTDSLGLKLVSDEDAPGNSTYYGTDAAGVKGYHSLPPPPVFPTLGSAAYEDIGTSGATVPLLSTANTWSADNTFLGDVATPQLHLADPSQNNRLKVVLATELTTDQFFYIYTNDAETALHVLGEDVVISGINTGNQNLFRTIAVSGQSDVVADSTADVLTLVAGTNVTITTDAATDTITISATGGGGGVPGGSDTQVQYNDGGAFGGSVGLVFNETTNALTIGTGNTASAAPFLDLRGYGSASGGSGIRFGEGGIYGYLYRNSSNVMTLESNNHLGLVPAQGVCIGNSTFTAHAMTHVKMGVIGGGDATYPVMILQAKAAQTSNYLECLDSADNRVVGIDISGAVTALPPSSGAGNSLNLKGSAAVSGNTDGGNVVLTPGLKAGAGNDGKVVVKAASSSPGANLQEWQDIAGGLVGYVSHGSITAEMTLHSRQVGAADTTTFAKFSTTQSGITTSKSEYQILNVTSINCVVGVDNSIGAWIYGGGSGLCFNTADIKPMANSAALNDNVTSLGTAANRFKNVYAADFIGGGFPLTPTFALALGINAVVGTNLTNQIIIPRNGVITKAFIAAKTGPTGADLIVDINKNGTSIWNSTPANRLKIVAGATAGNQSSFDTTALTEGDLLTIDIDQIGSTIAGSNITVTLLCLMRNQ